MSDTIILIVSIVLITIITIRSIIKRNTFKKQILDLQTQLTSKEKSLSASRNSIRGQVSEELAPIFSEFPYDLSDCKFFGSPIDYIVFDGMSKLRDTGEGEITIIVSDVKTNKASLSKVQKGIKDAIENCRFKFEVWNIKEGKLTVK